MIRTWERMLSTIYGVISLLAAAAMYFIHVPNLNSLSKMWIPLILLSIALFMGYRVAQGVFIAMSGAFGAGMIINSIIPSDLLGTVSGIAWGVAFLVPSVLTLFIWCKQRPQLHHGT